MQETEDLEELPASSIENGKRHKTREEKTEDITVYEPQTLYSLLLDKQIPELARTHPALMTFKSVELSPATWMAVSWVASFIESLLINIINGNKCKKKNQNKNGSSGGGSISLPSFGLATYKMQEDLWLNPEPCEYERISYLYSAADSWLRQLNVYHHDFNFFTQHPTPTTL
ncbi:hypothetical protein Ahy_A05g023767 [Arachis hypogaea]|uniref:Uncharacterized protein n=1 Tax=Arachis hypogaea TaxID=3818 RepID=A0A445D527_ARAHY|nr:hypothetical protein Ahy_A05g023767 [Arachis hypogaea]